MDNTIQSVIRSFDDDRIEIVNKKLKGVEEGGSGGSGIGGGGLEGGEPDVILSMRGFLFLIEIEP